MKYITIFLFLALTVVFSCDNTNREFPVNVTGKPGEILVIIEENIWNREPGEELRQSLTSFQPALQQEEPMFKLFNISPSSFGDFFRSNRNIIYVKPCESTDSASVQYKNDVWAKPQSYVEITSPDIQQLVRIIHNNKNKILDFFIVTERKRLQDTYKTFREKEIIQKLSSHHISLVIPKGYQLEADSTDFVRISSETPAINQSFLIYEYNYSDTNVFTNEHLLAKRDSFLRSHIPGTVPGSWMTTEHNFSIVTNKLNLNNRGVYEIRGLWKVQNDFMNGPFISLTTVDKKRNKVITVEGYVYAPKSDKLEYIRQMEAILYTLQVTD